MYFICMLQASTSKKVLENIATLFRKRPGKIHHPIYVDPQIINSYYVYVLLKAKALCISVVVNK